MTKLSLSSALAAVAVSLVSIGDGLEALLSSLGTPASEKADLIANAQALRDHAEHIAKVSLDLSTATAPAAMTVKQVQDTVDKAVKQAVASAVPDLVKTHLGTLAQNKSA